MEIKEIDLHQILEEGEQKRLAKIKDLESCSKTLSELLVVHNFNVNNVISETYPTVLASYPERILDGRPFAAYQGGFKSRLIITVTPDDKDNPIRTLNFKGFSPVKIGDYICAQIPRYKEEKLSLGFHNGLFDKERVFYFDRKFNQKESAIELIIFSENKDILRIDRAVDYNKYIKK